MVKLTENLDGAIVRREVCVFNQFSDVRTCFDWDNGSKRRDMKNANGDWYKVEGK